MEKIGVIASFINSTPGTWETAYEVPEDKAVIICTINICNIDGTPGDFSIGIGTGTEPVEGYLYSTMPYTAGQTMLHTAKITLQQGQKIFVLNNTGATSFNFFGSIIDQTDFP